MSSEILSIEDWVLPTGTVPAVKDKQDFIDRLTKAVQDMRAALDRAQIAHDVTPRTYQQVGALVGQGLDFAEAAALVLSGPLETSEWLKVSSSVNI